MFGFYGLYLSFIRFMHQFCKDVTVILHCKIHRIVTLIVVKIEYSCNIKLKTGKKGHSKVTFSFM